MTFNLKSKYLPNIELTSPHTCVLHEWPNQKWIKYEDWCFLECDAMADVY
jgi:hypothetical protein